MNKPVVIVAIVVGILLLVTAGFYFVEPAKSLPAFFPGHDAALVKHHYTHGVGALVLALGAFAFAWFQSGKDTSQND